MNSDDNENQYNLLAKNYFSSVLFIHKDIEKMPRKFGTSILRNCNNEKHRNTVKMDSSVS